jgi:hypothetical protein
MARYQVPPDPRQSDNPQRPRFQRHDQSEPIPWFWLGLGLVVTIIALILAYNVAAAFLVRPPLAVDPLLDPTIIVLTAPPSPMPTATEAVTLPTIVPTFTPIPTPDNAIAPDELTVGFYAQVANTEGTGVRIRGGPSVSNISLLVVPEDVVALIIDGPTENDGFLWWHLQLEDGTEGWAAGDFLIPAAAP